MTRAPLFQPKITSTNIKRKNTIKNIEASGDTLEAKQNGVIRIAFQNIHGTSDLRGLAVPAEIEAIEELEIDIMGMAETNKPWTNQDKSLHDAFLNRRLKSARTLYTAAPPQSHSVKYQPGGNLLTANGEITARIDGRGTDKMGRFCWFTFAGKRDEGVLVIVAYRVCQEKTNSPGPHTAFQQQYVAMRDAGVKNPNPRSQLLKDLQSLIQGKRQHGYRPILLIDANGDYQQGKDKGLQHFLDETQLEDPYASRFGHTRTYIHGSSRLDYIFMDKALLPSIKRIGYLGTHDGAPSDHLMAYVDMEQESMFAGLINRPPVAHSREILIEQEDKVQKFLREVQARFDEHTLAERVFELAKSFAEAGPSQENIDRYNKLYGQFLELVRGAAKKIGKKKHGYARSTQLATAGTHVLLWKYVIDCRHRGAPPTKKLTTLCKRLEIDIEEVMALPEKDLRIRMRTSRKHLWEAQKNCESLRLEYLEGEAKANAIAAGDHDWVTRVNTMKRKMKQSAMNRKLTAVTKGRQGALNMIQVPTHDWFYSDTSRELYHYHHGVFEAYPAATESLFFSHHTRKVLPGGVQAVQVERDRTNQFWIISTLIPMPEPLWRDITSAEEIEHELLQRNKMHLEQTAREEGISVKETLSALRENNGFNPLSEKVLNGEQITEYELTPEMAAYFQALKRTPKERELTPILGSISSVEFQEMFKRAKERTSSDSRTPNYTIWKCLAKSDKISGFASVLLSLPFVYGFPNGHWIHMTDFMLEKKPGVRQIHLLRIIGKVPAEFNTCLKLIIGKRARDNFESTDTCDEQHGFRPNRSAQDAMMLKLLAFECARMQKYVIGSLQHDMTAHFDRISPENTAFTAAKYGVSKNVMTSIGSTLALLERNVETSLGISDGTYKQEPGEPRIGGMVQGKADVPQLSTQQSDLMLKAHKSLSYGVDIISPGMHRSITHHSIAFADDTDGQVSSEMSDKISIPRIVRRLQHSGQTWNDITNICGGLIAHHKCFWQMLAWENVKGHLLPAESTTEQLLLYDGKGAYAEIEYLPADKPNIGLGFSLCPTGNQLPHFERISDKIRELCVAATGAHLTEGETQQLLMQRLVPKLSYALHGTSFSRKQCGQINSMIRRTILPRLRLNRNFPSAVLYGPMEYGGLEFPETYTLQDQVQLDYLIKQLRWDKVVANDFLVTLDSVQMCSGFVTPILEDTKVSIEYLSPSYIIELRKRLAEINAYIWIEKCWTPKLQREGDAALMERFAQCPLISRAMLRKANAVRIYLRVITIADLADVRGSFIPAGILTGKWQAGSDLKWPYQPLPPATFWSAFRRCLRLTFSTKTPPYHHPTHSLDLDCRLGKWSEVPRNTWYNAYRSKSTVFWRNEDDGTLHQMRPSQVSGFHHLDRQVHELPHNCHPIRFRQIDGRHIWSHGKYAPTVHMIAAPQPGRVIEDNIKDEASPILTIGSDGSVLLHEGKAACSWILHHSEKSQLRACYILEPMTSLSSYRSELEGIYRGLKQILTSRLTPQQVTQWCDNKAAVDRSNVGLNYPGAMLTADADILLAISHTRKEMTDTTFLCRHVYGHQDSRRQKTTGEQRTDAEEDSNQERKTSGEEDTDIDSTPHMTKPKKTQEILLPLSARLNIECDKLATETIQAPPSDESASPLPQVLQLPYPGSKALLNIDSKWITSQQRRYICRGKQGQSLIDYCRQRYGWDQTTFDAVYWTAIRTVRANSTSTQQRQTSKIMHGWLPVGHMHGHATGNTHCPGCPCTDETMDHLFRCPNEVLMKKKDDLVTQIRTKGISNGIPRVIMETLSRILYDLIHGNVSTVPDHPSLARAVRSQMMIGTRLLPRGFIAKDWLECLKDFGVQQPEQKMSKLLKLIWFEFTDTLWRDRNEIAHGSNSQSREHERETWASKLRWYLENKHVIAPTDQFVLSFTEEGIDTMPTLTRRQLVQNLERLERVFAVEQRVRATGQRTIRSYFGVRQEIPATNMGGSVTIDGVDINTTETM